MTDYSVVGCVQLCRDGSQLSKALAEIQNLILDGMRHGFFEYSITCEIVKDAKRQIVVRAGKSHKFIIPEGELPR